MDLQKTVLDDGATAESVLAALEQLKEGKVKLSPKAAERILTICSKSNISISSSVLLEIAKHKDLVDILTRCKEVDKLSSLLDMFISSAFNTSSSDKMGLKLLRCACDYINKSPYLKSRLCLSVHEYVFVGINDDTMHPSIINAALELVYYTIFDCEENMNQFAQSTSKDQMIRISSIAKNSSDPMVQMKIIELMLLIFRGPGTNADKKRTYGAEFEIFFNVPLNMIYNRLHQLVFNFNRDRTDDNRIICFDVRNIVKNNMPISGDYHFYCGPSNIVLFSAVHKQSDEVFNITSDTIEGFGSVDGHLFIQMKDTNDSYLSMMDSSRDIISFDPIIPNTNIEIVKKRFGEIKISALPVSQITPVAQTPSIRNTKNIAPTKFQEQKSITPKISAKFVKMTKEKKQMHDTQYNSVSRSHAKEETNKDVEPYLIKEKQTAKFKSPITRNMVREDVIKPIEVPKKYKDIAEEEKNVAKLRYEKKEVNKPVQSSKSGNTKQSSTNRKNSVKKSPKNEHIKTPRKETPKISQNEFIKEPKKETSKVKKIETKNQKEDVLPKKEVSFAPKSVSRPTKNEVIKPILKKKSNVVQDDDDNSEIDVMELDPLSEQSSETDSYEVTTSPSPSIQQDSIPTPNISQSFSLSESEESEEDHVVVHSPPEVKQTNEIKSSSKKKIISSVKRREYTPERWELETFDELKCFGNTIKSRLNERHLLVDQATEEMFNDALKEIDDFITRIGSELDTLHSEFTKNSSQTAKEIQQKQEMVTQLGEQQCGHIEQMKKECVNAEKRIQDMFERFNQQKKNLLQNQEKHISLFRDDMRCEFKAADTNKKRENSKQMVQKLVTLLDEL